MSQTHPQLLLSRRQFLRLLAGAAAAGATAGLASSAAAEPSLDYLVGACLQRLRRSGHIASDEQTAWSVYDFCTNRNLVSINDTHPLQAASMIKPFLAQAYLFRHWANSNRYPYDGLVRMKMEEMIRNSDNNAANFFIHRVGCDCPVSQRPREVERVLKRYGGGIFQQTSIVEFIPSNGRTYRNRASARDYSRFLTAMYRNQLPYAEEIKYCMGLPNRNRIEEGAADVPNSVKLYHKTGTTAHLCGDMGVLVARDCTGRLYPYTFVGIVQKAGLAKDYGSWMRSRGDVIREVSNLVYTFMRKYHNLVA